MIFLFLPGSFFFDEPTAGIDSDPAHFGGGMGRSTMRIRPVADLVANKLLGFGVLPRGGLPATTGGFRLSGLHDVPIYRMRAITPKSMFFGR